ncbi:nuclear transport factor 2 family protein [Domibacillus epiphyticus]|uniref:DUF4440 domain-containing protein n=1 Tax=Domibacillus epiphyticus TaxID=1714355 RepID=A0A1V2ACX7_9BACI|nr:DUF4440 domain-containing protein [Domibacillus epiphyticus]OMP68702.1 DUF4440 domain-containing protein [Domibacillus epiphyticus]
MESQLSLKKHLLHLEQKLLKPEIRTSRQELTKLLADEFFEFGSSGHIWYRKDGISEEGIGVVKMTLYDFDIHQLSSDSVLATYRTFNEETMQHTLRSSIWKFKDERWQMFFHQGTKTKDRQRF